ncbi:membrane protein insertion efficiency factor YidD [Deinococcus reticulitermitis]|uniref:membrane protein insertion efficiency factor YidD n=1 Tax=Deinococcus reticulitermitis TaxID=856736 RepID=UPI000B8092E2|nr:membrane protein insertion efficiency factor YidD [Deinococcus reticulitermitis]
MPLLDGLALRAIRLYQRRLSRHKGFRCAHAALHGGASCSAAVARIVREDGLWAGRSRVAARFQACRAAHTALRGGSPLALGSWSGARVQGVCCCGPLPIPFRCG